MKTTVAAAAGIAGAAVGAGVPTILGAVRPGYDPARDLVSLLSLGPGGWMNGAALVASGLGIAAFGAGGSRSLNRWVRRLFTVAGGGLVVAGLFPHDPGLHYPPGAAASYTAVGAVHEVAGGAFFLSLAAACLVTAWTSREKRPRFALASGLAGSTVLGAFIATGVALGLQYGGQWPTAPAGLLERLAMFAGLAWLAGVAAFTARDVRRQARVGDSAMFRSSRTTG